MGYNRLIYIADITLRRDNSGTVETTVLRLSTSRIDADKMSVQYIAALQGVPSLTRSKQELFYGNTTTAIGSISIANGVKSGGTSGRFDEFLPIATAGWVWDGQPIIIKQGNAGQNVSAYTTIFNRVMARPAYTEESITVGIRDKQISFLDRVFPVTSKTLTMREAVDMCLQVAGNPDKDDTLFNAWNTEFGSKNIHLVTSQNDTVLQILDRILTPTLVWYGFDRDGRFILQKFRLAQASDKPVLSLFDDIQILSGTFTDSDLGRHYWRVGVSYISTIGPPVQSTTVFRSSGKSLNNAAATNVGSGVVGIPVNAHGFTVGQSVQIAGSANYSGNFVVQSGTSTNQVNILATFVAETFTGNEHIRLADLYPNQKDTLTQNALYTASADAESAAQDWVDVFSVPRRKYTFTLKTRPMIECRLGDVIQLSRPRFLTNPEKMVIVGFNEDYSNQTVSLECIA